MMRVGKLITELIKQAADRAVPFPLSTVLIYLVDEVGEEHNTLARLEQKVAAIDQKFDQHILAPFKTGMLYLEEAQNAPTKSAKQKFLQDAQREFIEASQINLPLYPIYPIKAHFFVGVCYDLLADSKNALRWYEKSHGLVVSFIRSQDVSSQELARIRGVQLSLIKSELNSIFFMYEYNKAVNEGRQRRESQLTIAFKDHSQSHPQTQFDRELANFASQISDPSWSEPVNRRQEHRLILKEFIDLVNSQGSLDYERQRVVEKLFKLANPPYSVDELLDPFEYDPQTRNDELDVRLKQDYFKKWSMGEQEAEDICSWAIDLTNLLASRMPKRKRLGAA